MIFTKTKDKIMKIPGMGHMADFFAISNAFFKKYYYLHNFVLSFFAAIIIEAFNRRSLLSSLHFLVFNFDLFFINFMLIFSTVSVSVVLKKRNFWKYFTLGCWLVAGIVNYIMYVVRLVPFTFNDILLIRSTVTVIPFYLTVFQIVLLVLFIILLIGFVVFMFIKASKFSFSLKRNWIVFLTVLFVAFITFFGGRALGSTNDRVHGLISKLERNGFSYCFVSSAFDRGMSEPDDYSKKSVEKIKTEFSTDKAEASLNANIVFVQLESYFNPNQIKGVTYSENPVPVFENLQNDYSHGTLCVPSFGAGTANTEFEVLTGINLDFLGIGEVAYRTVVEDQTVETMCHTLKDHGYTTHAIHNNDATFYNRNLVFQNLGFDTFTSVEYMQGLEYNHMGWAKDKILTSSIEECLKSTEGLDLVYAIGVQPHGAFPSDYPAECKTIDSTGFQSIGSEESFEYFLSQVKEDDDFLGELVKYFETFEEPTVIVIFGDHLPAFRFENNMFTNNNKYLTEYVMWSNFDMENIEKNISTYQLYSYVFDRLNINGNLISDIHRNYNFNDKNKGYFDKLEMIQFDMTEGNCYSSDSGRRPKTKAKLGIKNISLKSAYLNDGYLIVKGENFNEFSKVFIDDDEFETKYISCNELRVKYDDDEKEVSVCVTQVDKMGEELTKTNNYILE